MFVQVDTPAAMERLGSQLGQNCAHGTSLYLQGELGAGKTTLVRGFLRGSGYEGKVKSPTYTLVEPYNLPHVDIFHFDLYRLTDIEDLEHIGFRDYFDGQSIALVEWPERGASLLHEPDLLVMINVPAAGRALEIQAISTLGKDLLLSIQ